MVMKDCTLSEELGVIVTKEEYVETRLCQLLEGLRCPTWSLCKVRVGGSFEFAVR